MSVIEMRAPCGASPPLRIHKNEDGYSFVLEGTMRFSVNGKEIVAHAGQMAVPLEGAPHTFRVESKTGLRVPVTTRGADLENTVHEIGMPTDMTAVDAPMQPRPEQIGAPAAASARNNIEVIGPPPAQRRRPALALARLPDRRRPFWRQLRRAAVTRH